MGVLFEWGVYVSLFLYPELLMLCTLKTYFLKSNKGGGGQVAQLIRV